MLDYMSNYQAFLFGVNKVNQNDSIEKSDYQFDKFQMKGEIVNGNTFVSAELRLLRFD